MSVLSLKITSPDGVLCEDTASYVRLQAADGSVGVLPGHAPMLVALVKGQVCYRKDGAMYTVDVDRGVAEIKDNRIVILSG